MLYTIPFRNEGDSFAPDLSAGGLVPPPRIPGQGPRGALKWRRAFYALPFQPVKRLLVVTFLVLAASVWYRVYGSPETGTGSLTLPQPAPNTGEAAPDFGAVREDGESFELSDNGIYVLTFWSTLNKDTAEARPEFEEMARDYAEEGVTFAVVYVSNVPESEEDVPYTVLQDGSGELTAKYNVKRVPRLFLVDDGTIELVQNGYYQENEERLREELDQVLSSKT